MKIDNKVIRTFIFLFICITFINILRYKLGIENKGGVSPHISGAIYPEPWDEVLQHKYSILLKSIFLTIVAGSIFYFFSDIRKK